MSFRRLLGIEKTKSTPYRPQSGLVERFNRTIITMLAAFVNENEDECDDHLPNLIMAFRATHILVQYAVQINLCLVEKYLGR